MDEESTKKDENKKSKIKDSNWGVSVGNSRYQSPENNLNRASSHINTD